MESFSCKVTEAVVLPDNPDILSWYIYIARNFVLMMPKSLEM